MYTCSLNKLGSIDTYSISTHTTNNSFTISPKNGACTLNISFQNTHILDTCLSEEELSENLWAKGAFLFPFPNRLKDGTYSFQGNTYQFPINEPSTNSALHGFGIQAPFSLSRIELSSEEGAISFSYTYDGQHTFYPFPFILSLKFSINDKNAFKGTYEVLNIGSTSLPFGFGWHPYFILDDDISRSFVQLPSSKAIEVDEKLIPTGKKITNNDFKELAQIQSTVLDSGYILENPDPKSIINFQGENGKIEYWQETGDKKFNFFQLFIPPSRKSLAIEPMSCNINAFNNQEGLISLNPGEIATASFGLNFKP